MQQPTQEDINDVIQAMKLLQDELCQILEKSDQKPFRQESWQHDPAP